MKNRIIAFMVGIILLMFSSSLHSQITFERWYGGIGIDWGWSVCQTSKGGYVIVGYTKSFGLSEYDVYLIKTDSLGDTLWTRTYGGTDDDCGYSVVQTTDGGYIAVGRIWGGGHWDVYLIKTDANGDTIWTRTYGGNVSDWASSVVQTTDGGYIVTGTTWSYGAGQRDFYLIKTDSLGDTIWTKTYGGTIDDGGYSVIQTSDGGYIIGGYTQSYGAGQKDFYLIKTDSLGNVAGIKEAEERGEKREEGKLYSHPNPFTTSTTINLTSTGHGTKGMELHIYDVSGRLVKSVKLATSTYQLGTDLKAGILPQYQWEACRESG